MFPVLTAGLGAAKTITSYRGAVGDARSQRKAGKDSLLTARYNINQRKLESRQTQFGILEQGHQAASKIQTAANQAVASATVAAGSSGAIVGEGTPRAVLKNIAQEGLHAQMGAILNTKNAIKAQARQTEANNKTEWNQANAYASGMNRDAKRTMDNARIKLVGDIAQTALSTYSAGSAGGTKKFSWGIGAAKSAKDKDKDEKKKDKEVMGEDQRYRSNPVKKHSLYETTKDRIVDWKEGRRSFDLDKIFDPSAWVSALSYTKEKKWTDPLGKAYQFATGTGLSGKAHPKKFNYGPRTK